MSGIAVGTGSFSKFFYISTSEEVKEISIDVIALRIVQCLANCAYKMVPPIILKNEAPLLSSGGEVIKLGQCITNHAMK